MNQKKNKFIKFPELEGGNIEFRKFIEENLIYPEEAKINNIEGLVLVSYDVNDNGNICNEKVLKGIGYGCDEEALRLIRLLSFSKVKNKGLRLKVSKKAKILFKLKATQSNIIYNYSYTNTAQNSNPSTSDSGIVFNWTIDISQEKKI